MVSRTPRLRVCHLWRSTESRTDLARTRSAGKTAIRQFVSVRCDLSRTRRKGESFGLAGQSLRESGKRLLVAKGGSDLRQYAQRAAFSGAGTKSFWLEPMKIDNFFAELKRRKVYTVAVAYVVAGWALAQGIAQVFPVFDIPNWAVRLFVLLIVLGFPVALILSWFFDFTRYGIVRTPDVDVAGKVDIAQPANSTERSIAILPFVDLSPAKDHNYFSDGIADEISTALAKIDGLRVAARRSSFWFKDKEAELTEIAEKLNVEHVLEGTVRRDGNRVRISAELIDACDGFTLWSETYEREMHGIFALQDEITRSIVDALKLKLAITPSALARCTYAYDDYLHG